MATSAATALESIPALVDPHPLDHDNRDPGEPQRETEPLPRRDVLPQSE